MQRNLVEAGGHRAKAANPAIGNDQPQPAEVVNAGTVLAAWKRAAAGVRVPAANEPQTAAAGAAMGVEQMRRVDFEASAGSWRDVAGDARLGHPAAGAEQQAAGFERHGGPGGGGDRLKSRRIHQNRG